jgi:hypothetical protein
VTDHDHLWHEDARGVVRCAFQSCTAEPTELEAAETLAQAELVAAMRVELIYRGRDDAA